MSKEKVIELANSQVGYLEKTYSAYKKNPLILNNKKEGAGYDNYTLYWEDIAPDMQGNAWCQCFIDWLFYKIYGYSKALKMLYASSFTFYTPTQALRFYNNGAWFESPMVGDIVYYRSDSHKGEGRWKEIYHVEYVVGVNGDYILTVGGNTNNDTTRIEANGGAVANKTIKWATNGKLSYNIVAGFGRPSYDPEYTIGWHRTDSGKWWWANSKTTWLKNEWKLINDHWYYFGSDGYAYTGVHKIENEIFYFVETPGHPKECALCCTNDRGALVPWKVKIEN